MDGATIVAIITAVGNVIVGIWGLFKKKERNQVAEGIQIIEKAIEENKVLIDDLAGKGAGKQITSTIKGYGDAAKSIVDTARKIASTINGK